MNSPPPIASFFYECGHFELHCYHSATFLFLPPPPEKRPQRKLRAPPLSSPYPLKRGHKENLEPHPSQAHKISPTHLCTYLRNLGYWPTMYMMLEAMMALLSLPLFCSHRPSSSLMTVTRNLFSSSSCIAPLMDPTAQHSYTHAHTKITKIMEG